MAGSEPIRTARAEALFVSHLSAGEAPGRAEVDAAIAASVRRWGGIHGCATEVAAAYGEYPETAPSRMCWARAVVDVLYDAPERRPRRRRPIAAVPAPTGAHRAARHAA
jgi:hypothetical protein